MSCYRSSNNKFFNSPSKMSDGRIFTDYRPNCEMNRYIESGNKLKNTHDWNVFIKKWRKTYSEKSRLCLHEKWWGVVPNLIILELCFLKKQELNVTSTHAKLLM